MDAPRPAPWRGLLFRHRPFAHINNKNLPRFGAHLRDQRLFLRLEDGFKAVTFGAPVDLTGQADAVRAGWNPFLGRAREGEGAVLGLDVRRSPNGLLARRRFGGETDHDFLRGEKLNG